MAINNIPGVGPANSDVANAVAAVVPTRANIQSDIQTYAAPASVTIAAITAAGNSAGWGATGSGLTVKKSQTFTSSGTFTLPSGYGVSKPLVVDMIISGGGGGGGGGSSNITGATGFSGGGGGSGCVIAFNNISLTANATVTIGAGGSGGAAGATNSSSSQGGTGGDGGVSNVNSLFYAPGGSGGCGGPTVSKTLFSNHVRGYGFYISGSGYGTNSFNAPGGSGGSGGIGGTTTATGYYVAGSYGHAPIGAADAASRNTNDLNITSINQHGHGQLTTLSGTSTNGSNQLWNFLIRDTNIRGGGGSGGANDNGTANNYGLGGSAGGYTGGTMGLKNQTTGSKDGGTATIPGAAGGGGGGACVTSAGNGGAGAAGYVTIVWYE